MTAFPPSISARRTGSGTPSRTCCADAVVIVVAERDFHRRGPDRILVLDDGRLVAQGTHQELMESSTSYREIAASQLALESLP